ncbi:MAG: D-alanyl-D-alanine carboxypeptidase [Nitrospirae bacterium]|nr:MAG: D-alanyl-D-alanine carboxypeptidase [Nitrospirota bacterium]
MKNRQSVVRFMRNLQAASLAIGCLLLVQTAGAEEIRSRAAVVMDAETGRVLYAKNPDQRLMPASTTKLMTALVVLERARLSDVTTVSKKASQTSPTRVGLKEGDKVTIETLLYAALMRSANDASVALAEAVGGSEEQFVGLMNRKAIAIGANNTHFINANGLPGKGQYITAYDLAKIMRQAIKYPVLKEIINTRITEVATEAGKTMFIKNTNKLLWSDEEILGGKTGYTRQARHCFVCAGERDKETLIVSLLGTPSRDLLWKESEELMAFGSKVLNKTEEPVVYLARTDDRISRASRAVYSPEGDGGSGSMKVHGERAVPAKHKKYAKLSSKKRTSKLSAKNKKGAGKMYAKKRSPRKKARGTTIALYGDNGPKG